VGPISGGELIVLLVLAAIVLGPERLPNYAQQLARLVRELRRMAQGATAQVRQEMGDEFNDVDWKKLDPRQYDPRRIVKEALLDPLDEAIAPVRGEIDSVRTAAGRKGAATDATVAGGAAVTAGTEAVGTEPSLGEPAVYVSVDRSAWDPARPTPYDPDAT
jgi:sec-independent protein translocase protein TatB